jgi:hypothetical protein
LGFEDSHFEVGQHVVMCCRVLVHAGDWKAAQQYAMRNIFDVSDYRKPVAASLSQAYLNMVDLMRSKQGGWSNKLMAFYNIESPATVTHASPLGIVEAALLTQDEAFFKERALPTIAYTLSRPSAHFAAKVPKDMHVYVNEQRITLTVPSQFYGAAYWQGLHDMLGRRNEWLDKMIFGKGIVQYANSYSTIPKWSELLANYREHPDAQLLTQIKKEADQFLADEVYAHRTDSQNIRRFYNISFYPYWWDLQDLYDLHHGWSMGASQTSAAIAQHSHRQHIQSCDADVVVRRSTLPTGVPDCGWCDCRKAGPRLGSFQCWAWF